MMFINIFAMFAGFIVGMFFTSWLFWPVGIYPNPE